MAISETKIRGELIVLRKCVYMSWGVTTISNPIPIAGSGARVLPEITRGRERWREGPSRVECGPSDDLLTPGCHGPGRDLLNVTRPAAPTTFNHHRRGITLLTG